MTKTYTKSTLPWEVVEFIPSGITLLIDGDILCYRAAAGSDGRCYTVGKSKFKYKKDAVGHCKVMGISDSKIALDYEPSPVSHALHTLKLSVDKLLAKYPGSEFKIYLTGNSNFRYGVYKDYKAHRSGGRVPEHLADCKQFLVNRYHAVVSTDCEADDMMSIEAKAMQVAAKVQKILKTYVVCTIDKDMDMIYGYHYNWNKDEEYFVGRATGIRAFYRQLLTGDAVDNIPGLKGVGKVTAAKLIHDGMKDDAEMYMTVLKTYCKKEPWDEEKEVEEEYITRKVTEVSRNARLLWLQTQVDEVWQPPSITLEETNDEEGKEASLDRDNS